MCRLLQVSTSGYYDSLTRPPSEAEKKREIVTQVASEIYKAEYKVPGYRKIYHQMNHCGVKCSAETVRLVCRRQGILSCVVKRKKRPKTTDSRHHNRVNKNILNRDFKAERPNEKWLTDITYIETKNGFVYLSAIIDLFSRRVIGWCVESHMRTEMVVETLKRAIDLRGEIPTDLLFHSDRGVQYTSEDFHGCLELLGMTQSMSEKGQCWDNAPCESFWGKLKAEWLNQRPMFENIDEVRLAVFEYIEGYYYNTRLHQGLGYRTPREVEEEFFEKSQKNIENSLTKEIVLC